MLALCDAGWYAGSDKMRLQDDEDAAERGNENDAEKSSVMMLDRHDCQYQRSEEAASIYCRSEESIHDGLDDDRYLEEAMREGKILGGAAAFEPVEGRPYSRSLEFLHRRCMIPGTELKVKEMLEKKARDWKG